MRKILSHTTLAMAAAIIMVSCSEHEPFPDTSIHEGHVVSTDGHVMSLEQCRKEKRTPIAVIFHVSHDEEVEGKAFAVYLHDLPELAFSDTLAISQNTSSDVTLLDGNSNTYAIYSTPVATSDMADAVFSMWAYGQSAYVPSVAQMKMLYLNKELVNKSISSYGGDLLPGTADACWYWTSTEVRGQEKAKAWLFSMESGAMQETPKDEEHKVRPVITIY